MIAQLYSAAVLGRFVKIKCRFHWFGLNWLGAQCAYERGSVVILIVLTLVLFPPLNCTHVLAHLEINSTSWKNSRKNGIQIYIHTYVCVPYVIPYMPVLYFNDLQIWTVHAYELYYRDRELETQDRERQNYNENVVSLALPTLLTQWRKEQPEHGSHGCSTRQIDATPTNLLHACMQESMHIVVVTT